jgi:hypothetical protein
MTPDVAPFAILDGAFHYAEHMPDHHALSRLVTELKIPVKRLVPQSH